MLEELRPRITEHLPGVSAMRAAANLKVSHPMALADCFAVALAASEGAVLLTGDPEIIDRAGSLPCDVRDLRPWPGPRAALPAPATCAANGARRFSSGWSSMTTRSARPSSLSLVQMSTLWWLVWFVLGSLLYGGNAPIRIYAFAFIVLSAVTVLLLRGSRVAWVLVVLANGVAVVSVVVRGEWWWAVFHLALLALLLTPDARQYIWHQRI